MITYRHKTFPLLALKLDDKLEAVVIMKIKSIFQTGASLDRALFPILSCLVALSRGHTFFNRDALPSLIVMLSPQVAPNMRTKPL